MADSIDLCKLSFTNMKRWEFLQFSLSERKHGRSGCAPQNCEEFNRYLRPPPSLSLSLLSPELPVQYAFVKFIFRCIEMLLVWLIEVLRTTRWFAMDVQVSIVPCLIHSWDWLNQAVVSVRIMLLLHANSKYFVFFQQWKTQLALKAMKAVHTSSCQ